MIKAKELTRQFLIYNTYIDIMQLHNLNRFDKEIFREICNSIRHIKEIERSSLIMNPTYDQHVAMDDIVGSFKNLMTIYNVTENNVPDDLKSTYLDLVWDNHSTLSIIYQNKYEILSQSRYRYTYIENFRPAKKYIGVPNIISEYIWRLNSDNRYEEVRDAYYHQRILEKAESYDVEYKIFYENRSIFITDSVSKYYAEEINPN